MRKLKLILAAFTLMLGVGGASAQSWAWTSSEVGAGTYYLYNVGGGGFMVGANNWGTLAGVDATGGIPVTLAGSGTTFTISTAPTYSGKFLGSNGYVDSSTADWTFEAVAGQENVYKLKTGDNYIFANASADANSTPKTTTVGADPGTNMAYWKLISKDDLFATFNSATPESPVPATSLITNPGFGRNISKGYGWTVNASNQNMAGGDQTNQCAEHWRSAFTAKQTISSIPNGTYKIRLQAALTEYTVTGNDFPVVYIKSGSNESTAMFKKMANGEDSMSGMSASFSAGQYFTDYAEIAVLNGEIEIGVRGTRTDTWCVYDNFQLFYCGPIEDLTPYVQAYEAALSNAKAVDQSKKMRASIKQALQNAISTYEDGNVDENSQEALEAAKSALETATTNANKSIASYAIIATGIIPDNSVEGWTCENSNTFHINTWSVEGNPGNDPSNMVTPFIENWVAKGSYLGAGKVYYRLEGLEPGEVYYASALVRSYNEANSDAPNGPNFYINNVVTDLATDGTTFTYNGMSGIYATLGGTATIGEDGILELGVVINEDRNYNWVAFKNVRMQELAVAYNTAVAAAQALEGTIPTDAYAAVESALATYSDITVENIQSINALVETYSALVAPYAAFNALKANANTLKAVENDNTSANNAFGNAITTQAAAVENALTVDDIEDVISDLKTDVLTYVGAANPTDGNQFNLTFLLTNPSLEGLPTWQKAEGWDTEQADGNYQVMKNDAATSEDGTKTAFYEYWSYNAKANDKFNLYTSVTLPEGTYTMNCYAFAKQQDGEAGKTPIQGVYFYANNTQGDVVADNRLTQKSISFVNDAEQEVKIGLKPLSTGNTYNWMGIGYVELYKVPAKVYAIGEDEIYDTTQEGAGAVTLTRTIAADTWNTIWLPFSLTNEELKAAFGADVEVATFSEIPNPEEEGSSTISFDKMETPAISPKVPVLLKTSTPAVGNVYEFEGRTVVAGTPKVEGTNFDFVGTADSFTIPAEDYFIKDDKLYQSTGSSTIKGTRAYLKGKTDGARIMHFFIDGGETTGIQNVQTGTITLGKVYNLQGQEVKKAQKGVFIQNGKKVVLK